MRSSCLSRDKDFVELNNRPDVGVIWHVALEPCGVGHESSHKILDRVKKEVAHGDVCRICSRLSVAKASLDRNSLETGMDA